MNRARPLQIRHLSLARRLVIGSVRAGHRAAPMHGLLTIDVTDARARLGALDPPGSFTALVVSAVARAAAAFPSVHAWRDWRGRLVLPAYVDVTVMVEARTSSGPIAVAHLLADAHERSVEDLSGELRAVKQRPGGAPAAGRLAPLAPALARVPGAVGALYAVLGRTQRGRRSCGSVLVTAVGMFGAGAGHAIAPSGPYSLEVVVGGVSPRPWVRGDEVVVRELLDLTVSIDHRVVDGAPATRFAALVRELLEEPARLDLPEVDPQGR